MQARIPEGQPQSRNPTDQTHPLSPQASKAPTDKADAARQLVALYSAALSHLRAAGALVNPVKPEALLPAAEFDALQEARAASAAGDAAQEAALEAEWGELEAGFDEAGARAWATVLLQVRRARARARRWCANAVDAPGPAAGEVPAADCARCPGRPAA